MMKLIMKIAGCLLILAFWVIAGDLPPRPNGPVADYASIIDQSSRQKIADLAQALWEQAGFGLVVATFSSLGQESIDEYAPRLYTEWGIGKKETDEGALLLVSLDPRSVRIEVGRGSEGYLNDAKAGRLLDNYGIPSFRQDKYAEGLVSTCAAIAEVVAKEKNITVQMPSGVRAPQPSSDDARLSPLQIIFIILILGFLLGTRIGRSILFWMILSNMLGGGRGGHGSGGFGGGFGGGGFGGGFGGGMSSGGGASRRF